MKKGTESSVKRIFATSVSSITLDSLTSGFNIGSDITRNPNFNEMMGFTKDEVIEIINKTLDKPLNEDELKGLIEILQKTIMDIFSHIDAPIGFLIVI